MICNAESHPVSVASLRFVARRAGVTEADALRVLMNAGPYEPPANRHSHQEHRPKGSRARGATRPHSERTGQREALTAGD